MCYTDISNWPLFNNVNAKLLLPNENQTSENILRCMFGPVFITIPICQAGPKKTPFCVLKDELFTPEDELS